MVGHSHLLHLQRTAPQLLSQFVLVADNLKDVVVFLRRFSDFPLHSQGVAVEHLQPSLMVHLDHVVIRWRSLDLAL